VGVGKDAVTGPSETGSHLPAPSRLVRLSLGSIPHAVREEGLAKIVTTRVCHQDGMLCFQAQANTREGYRIGMSGIRLDPSIEYQ